MKTQVEITSHGYVVSAYLPDKDGCCHWERLRAFGDRQGDAREFAFVDCCTLSDTQLWALANRYDASIRYTRINGKRYIKQ